jgi:hypothetical protein
MALAKYEFLKELKLNDEVVGNENEELVVLRGKFTLEDETDKLEKLKKADRDQEVGY